MYIRRPLCVFGLLFSAVLTILLSVSGGKGRIKDVTGRLDGRRLSFEGTVKEIDEKKDKLVLQIGNISISDSDILLYLSDYAEIQDKLHIGSHIKATGRFSLFDEATNKGQFDLREYYAAKGLGYAVYDGGIISVSSSYDRIREGLRHIRDNTACVYERYFDSEEYGVIEALVLADKSSLDRDIKEEYQNAGISHILALSGLHIATFGLMIIGVLKRLRLPMLCASLAAAAVLIMYCIMTGMPVSAQRALIMFAVFVAATLTGRTYDIKTASAMAAVIMLMMNPDRIYDAGFILSFVSILGIGIVWPGIRELVTGMFGGTDIRLLHRSEKKTVRILMSLLRTMVFSVSLQLAILPFSLWFFYQIPAYGVLTNLIAVPLAGVLLIFSAAIGVAGNSVLNPDIACGWIEYIIKPAVYITKGILRLYGFVAGTVSHLPGNIIITGRPKVWQICIYYAALISAVTGGCILKNSERRMRERRRKSKRPLAIAFFFPLIPGMIILFAGISPGFELSALDVGQGQCFVIHGRDVPTVVYDCGSTDEKDVGEYRLIPFLKYCGISDVDTVFVSHLDKDHVNGVTDLLNEDKSGICVRRILIPGASGKEGGSNYAELLEAAKQRNVPIYLMSEGDNIKWEHLSVLCLSPMTAVSCVQSDINEGSLVLSVEYRQDKESTVSESNFRALFTGDIGIETEQLILKRYNMEYIKHDYLQVAHHGSRFSADAGFINSVSPEVAVISAGRNNRYGHPHKETLNILDKCPFINTCITGRDGETDCVTDGDRIRIFLFK